MNADKLKRGGMDTRKMSDVERQEADRQLLGSEILVMTGGHDVCGRHVLTFPTNQLSRVYTQYTVAHVVLLAEYYLDLIDSTTKSTPGGSHQRSGVTCVTFLADLRSCNKETICSIVDAMERLQMERKDSVGAVYVIQPKNKDMLKAFKKMTGLKISKKNPKVQTYEVVLLSEPRQLHPYIDAPHLTQDFGGHLAYDHHRWLDFVKSAEKQLNTLRQAIDHVPEAKDKICMMLEYDLPTREAECVQLVEQIRQKYNDIMRDLNLEHVIDETKVWLGENYTTTGSSVHPQIVHTLHYRTTKTKMEKLKQDIIRRREELKFMWQKAENRVLVASKIHKYKEKAERVLSWVREVGLPTLNQDPEIADCLSKAEILLTHYQTGFYSIAQNVLWLSKKIECKMETIIQDKGVTSTGMVRYKQHFHSSIQHFHQAVEKKKHVYATVLQFYVDSYKLSKWYRQTIGQLPLQLLLQTPVMARGRERVMLRGTTAWYSAIAEYLHRHPAPEVQHLNKLKNILPVVDNLSLRSQARLLIHRIEILHRLMLYPDQMELSVLYDISRWKEQVAEGRDDIALNVTSSTYNLAELHQDKLLSPQDIVESGTHSLQRVPKLKARNVIENDGPRVGGRLQKMKSKSSGSLSTFETLGVRVDGAMRSMIEPSHSSSISDKDLSRQSSVNTLPLSNNQTDLTINDAGKPGIGTQMRAFQSNDDSKAPMSEIPGGTVRLQSQHGGVIPKHAPERYVSLGNNPSVKSRKPKAVRSLNFDSVGETTGAAQSTMRMFGSLADSGIGLTPNELLVNTDHKSPQAVGDAIYENMNIVPGSNSSPQKHLRFSDGKQLNLDMIAHSKLEDEAKLDLMAAMVEDTDHRPSQELFQASFTREMADSLLFEDNAVLSACFGADPHHIKTSAAFQKRLIPQAHSQKRTSPPIEKTDNVSSKMSNENGLAEQIVAHYLPHTDNEEYRSQKLKSDNPFVPPIDTVIDGRNPDNLLQQHLQRIDSSQLRDYGIDIEEWVSQQQIHDGEAGHNQTTMHSLPQYQSAHDEQLKLAASKAIESATQSEKNPGNDTEAASPTHSTGKENTDSSVEIERTSDLPSRDHRHIEAVELQQVHHRLHQLEIDGVELQQLQLETSLNHTQHVLQEQEDLMAVRGEASGHHQRAHRGTARETDHHEENESEESGIFTHASSESKLRNSVSSSASHLGYKSLHASRPLNSHKDLRRTPRLTKANETENNEKSKREESAIISNAKIPLYRLNGKSRADSQGNSNNMGYGEKCSNKVEENCHNACSYANTNNTTQAEITSIDENFSEEFTHRSVSVDYCKQHEKILFI